MIPGVVQFHVYRPDAAAEFSNRVAEQASFSRQLTEALDRGEGSEESTERAGDSLEPWLRSPEKRALADSIERASRAIGVDPAVALAVAVAESSLDPSAVASDGKSAGTFQVRPTTADDVRQRIREGDVTRPPGTDDVALGVAYLRHLDDLFSGSHHLAPGLRTTDVPNATERQNFAVAAFNAGQGRVAAAQSRAAAHGGDPRRFEDIRPYLPEITRGYVDRVGRYADGHATGVTGT